MFTGVFVLTTQIQLPSKFFTESRLLRLKQGNGWNFNGVKRGRLEIIAEILLYCDQHKAKTSIMYTTNLNYVQLQSQLKFLTAQGFLSFNTGKYGTTEKGYRFLELFLGLYDILRDEDI
jgi:predicted transcriptional regulator